MSDTLYTIHTIASFSFLLLVLGWCVRGALQSIGGEVRNNNTRKEIKR